MKKIQANPINIFEVREPKGKDSLNKPVKIVELMKKEARADKELFYVIHLNSRKKLIQKELLALGTVDKCPVYIREIFRSALLNQAESIITVHNHPSGDPKPSQYDRDLWGLVDDAGRLLGVKVLDHIIITPKDYFAVSSEMGLLGRG